MRRFLKYLLGMVAGLAAMFALGVLWPSAKSPLPDAADTRLIRNARIINVELAAVGEPTDVLIQGGVIARIGDGPRTGPDVPILDAGGRYLLPGFWDMHTHAFQLSPQLHLPLAIANGVTGTRDLMDCMAADGGTRRGGRRLDPPAPGCRSRHPAPSGRGPFDQAHPGAQEFGSLSRGFRADRG